MTQLVLQPCGDDHAIAHYQDTIERPVQVSRIAHLLPESERRLVADTFGAFVAVWGVTAGRGSVNARKWRRMRLGDITLMYRKRRFFFKGEVAYKLHSPDLARELWGEREDGATWEYVFFLTDLEEIDIDVVQFNAAAGYKQSNVIQGFDVLPTGKSEVILEALELETAVGALLSPSRESESLRQALAELGDDLDVPATQRRRAEQALLRRMLLGNRRHQSCSICARVLPVDLLVIGHIRKRHSCDIQQKLDPANIMPVCLLGCDKLFENGYIHVSSTGQINLSRPLNGSDCLGEFVGSLIGKSCKAWSAASETYFRWHREHRRRFL